MDQRDIHGYIYLLDCEIDALLQLTRQLYYPTVGQAVWRARNHTPKYVMEPPIHSCINIGPIAIMETSSAPDSGLPPRIQQLLVVLVILIAALLITYLNLLRE